MTCLLLILALNLGAPSTVTVAPGEQLNVRIAGEGPPIVLLALQSLPGPVPCDQFGDPLLSRPCGPEN